MMAFFHAVLAAIVLCQGAFAALPAKGMVIFGSKRSGLWQVWRMNVDGSSPVRVSPNSHEAVMPTVSPDGRWIMYKEGNSAIAQDLWIMRNDGSDAQEVVTLSDETGVPVAPAWGTNGFYYMKGNKVFLFDPEAKTSVQKYDIAAFSHLSGKDFNLHGVSHDGRYLLAHSDLYRGGYTGTNGTFSSHNCALILDNQDKGAVYFFGPGCEPTTPPSGDLFYHVGDATVGNPDGCDIMRINKDDLMSRSSYAMEQGFQEANHGHEYWPRTSNDNQWLSYGGSTGCHSHYDCDYEIFVHKLGVPGDRTRLTNISAFDNWPHLWVGEVPAPVSTPGFQLSQASLSFPVSLGGANPAPKPVAVTSTGGYPLTGLSATESAAWLSITVSGSDSTRSLSNAVAIAGLPAGTHQTTVTVRADTVTRAYTVTLDVIDPSAFHVKMNAGDNTVAGWESDDPYVSGGNDYVKNDAFDLSGAVNPGPNALYQTVRHLGPTFNFPKVPDGNYRIRLHFADPAYDASAATSSRAMHVYLEGQTALYNYDIVAAAGGGHKAVIEEFMIAVGDGNGLTIAFDQGNGNDAFVAGIEIIATQAAPVPTFNLLYPAAGAVLMAGAADTVRWIALNANDAVLEISTDNGKTFQSLNASASIARGDPAWGKFPWIVPQTSSKECILRITDYFGSGSAKSGVFEIRSVNSGIQKPAPHALLPGIHLWPNPFRAGGVLTVGLAQPGGIQLLAVDPSGRRVFGLHAEGLSKGIHAIPWEGAPLTPGVYVIFAELGGKRHVKAFTVVP